jgi:hypothetical protein
VSTLPANGVVDNHGAAPPQWLARPIRLRARDGLLVPIEDWPDLQARLYAAGTRYAAEPLGSHALVRVLGPLAATAECRPAARRAVTREPAGDGSESRVTVDAALRDETLVSGARLWLAPGRNSGLPRVEAAVSQDGQAWQPAASVRAVPEWGWAGRTLFAAPDRLVEVVLDPVRARHLRMKITARGGEPRLMCVRGTPAAGP